MQDLFTQLSLVVALGAAIAVVMKLLRQPLIIGHIITGILSGPTMLNLIHDEKGFDFLSSFGVALLLYIVGLELSVRIIARLGKVVFFTTFTQVGLVTVAGAAAARLLNFGRLESLIIGLCLALSSTIIIVTLLHDKRETNRLYAQIAIGVLLLQDIVATLGKIMLSAKSGGTSLLNISLLLGRGIVALGILYIVSKYLLPKVVKFMQSTKELVFIFAIAWALGIATLFAHIGFSVEVGALLAGVSMAGLSVAKEMSSRLRPIRDFFIIIFLINLGHTLVPQQLKGVVVSTIVFSIIVLVLKPLFVLATLGLLGYTKKASFNAALLLSQISEFSLVFIVAATQHGFASKSVQAVIGMTALVTFAGSAYLIKYSDQIYTALEKHLRFFERKVTRLEQKTSSQSYSTIVFGYRKGGAEFIKTFKKMHKRFIVVDYDPEAIELIEKHHINFMYGDATDVELIEELELEKARFIVSTITDFATNEFLASWLKIHNPNAIFIASADSAIHAAQLYSEGASYVMLPHFIGSEKISTFIKRTGFKKSEFNKFREKHLRYLESHFTEEPA